MSLPIRLARANVKRWQTSRETLRGIAIGKTNPSMTRSAAMTPAAIVAAAARHYDGGMDAMVSDALADMSPRVHVFATGADAYNASQTRDDIRRGDVLHVPSESAVAVMVSAWPTALDMSTAGSAFHALADGIDWHAIPRVDGSGSDDYSASADVARRIVSDAAVSEHEPATSTRELYRIEYMDARNRWHRRRGGHELASDAVDAARAIGQRGDVHGWRVLDGAANVVETSADRARMARRLAYGIATGAVSVDTSTSEHEPAGDTDADIHMSGADIAPYHVQRAHTGTEDGYMWRVVDADGSPVDDSWHMHAESARADAADMAKLATLTAGERRAVLAIRAQCPAPHDAGLAVVDTATGEVIEYRTIDTRRPDSLTAASMLAMALDDYRGSAHVSIVTDDGRAFVPAVHRIAERIANRRRAGHRVRHRAGHRRNRRGGIWRRCPRCLPAPCR